MLWDVPDAHGPTLHSQAVAAAVGRAGDGGVALTQAGQQEEQGQQAEDGGTGIHSWRGSAGGKQTDVRSWCRLSGSCGGGKGSMEEESESDQSTRQCSLTLMTQTIPALQCVLFNVFRSNK